MQFQTRCGVEFHLSTPHASHFREPCSAVIHGQQQRIVAPPDPRRLIWRSQYSADLLAGQISHQPLICSFPRNGKDAIDNTDAGRIAQSHNMEKGSNRGKPGIPRTGLVVALLF